MQDKKIEELEKATNNIIAFLDTLTNKDYINKKIYPLIDQITENLKEIRKLTGIRIFSIRFNNHCYEKRNGLEKHESHQIENLELKLQEFLNLLDSKKQFAYLKKIESLYGTKLAENLLSMALIIKAEDKEEIKKEIIELLNEIKTLKNPFKEKIEQQQLNYMKLHRETEELKEKEKILNEGRKKGARVRAGNSQDFCDDFILRTDILKNISFEQLKVSSKKRGFWKTIKAEYISFRIKQNQEPVSDDTAKKQILKAIEKKYGKKLEEPCTVTKPKKETGKLQPKQRASKE